MSYMWKEFNIKTFPAETIVYRDGVFCADLSTLENGPINKKYDLPVHIIYVGEIAGENTLNIDVDIDNQPVFFTVRVKNKMPAFFNILIKNAGKNSEIRGTVLLENASELIYDCTARHVSENTGVFVKNKLFGRQNSKSKLTGTAIIDRDAINSDSDIGFSAMVESPAKIEFMPAQRISAVPNSADHSASIFAPSDMQIQYLRGAGLGTGEVNDAMRVAFMNDF